MYFYTSKIIIENVIDDFRLSIGITNLSVIEIVIVINKKQYYLIYHKNVIEIVIDTFHISIGITGLSVIEIVIDINKNLMYFYELKKIVINHFLT